MDDFSFQKTPMWKRSCGNLADGDDVEVKYDGGIPARTFSSGEIGRKLSLQQVLAILRTIRINYTIDNDKQITIKNN